MAKYNKWGQTRYLFIDILAGRMKGDRQNERGQTTVLSKGSFGAWQNRGINWVGHDISNK
jgi:hypothetical protein